MPTLALCLMVFVFAILALVLICEGTKDDSISMIAIGLLAIALTIGGIIWICLSTEQARIDVGTYDILTQLNPDGTEFQYIIMHNDKKIVNLYDEFSKSFPKGTRIKVTAYNAWKNGIYWMNDHIRFYDTIPPEEK